MNYNVLPGKEAVFERAFSSVVDAMQGNPAHRKSRLFRDVQDPGQYVIFSEWESEEGFRAFVKSEGFARVTQWGKEQILAARPSHQVYKAT